MGCAGTTKAKDSDKKDKVSDQVNGQIDQNLNGIAKKLTVQQINEKRKQMHEQLNQGEYNLPELHIPKLQPITTQ